MALFARTVAIPPHVGSRTGDNRVSFSTIGPMYKILDRVERETMRAYLHGDIVFRANLLKLAYVKLTLAGEWVPETLKDITS